MTTWIPPQSKYLNQWKYVEVGRFIPTVDKIIRHQKDKVSILLEWDEVASYANENGNTGIYSSVWLYDSRDIDTATRFSSLYFDLDSAAIEESHSDTIKLVEYFLGIVPESAIRIYFTGEKGFHVHIEAVVLGITPSNNLSGLFRYIANQLRDELSLTTLDFAVYDLRRMWRYPNSRHQKSGLYKVALTYEQLVGTINNIREYASCPHTLEIPEQSFSAKANQWYREWSYKQSTDRPVSFEERMARFNKHGTSVVKKIDDSELKFDVNLFKRCPAIARLWTKAETEHNLEHEERLFLCSILTYNDEAIWYLHQILQNCDDYNPEKTQSHIDDWVRRRELGIGGNPYSCDRANSVGVGCGNCNLEPIERKERIGNNLVSTGEIGAPSPIRYAYNYGKAQPPPFPVTIFYPSIEI